MIMGNIKMSVLINPFNRMFGWIYWKECIRLFET